MSFLEKLTVGAILAILLGLFVGIPTMYQLFVNGKTILIIMAVAFGIYLAAKVLRR